MEILLKNLKSQAEELRQCENKIQRQKVQIEEVSLALKSIQSNSMHSVRKELQKQAEELWRERQKIQMLRTGLTKIISLYESCEEEILSLEDGDYGRQTETFSNVDVSEYAKLLESLQIKISMQAF